MDIEKIRADTPCGNVYMNHASTSVPPLQVIRAANHYYEIIMQYGATSRRAEELVLEEHILACGRIAELIHAKPDEIAFMPNGTLGIGMISLSFPWKQGQNIIIDEMSFISNVAPWLQIKEHYGVEIRYLPAKLPGILDTDFLETIIDKNTALIVITHSANSLGIIQDAISIGNIAKEKNIRYLLDASETIGVAEVDVEKMQCDYLVASGRKYLRGPSGSGFLYVKTETMRDMSGCIPAWNSGMWNWKKEIFSYYDGIQKWNYGEKNYPAIFGLSEAVKYLGEIGGQKKAKERIDMLLSLLIKGVRQIHGINIIGPENANLRAGVMSFCVEGQAVQKVAQYLNEHNVGMMGHHFFCPGILKIFRIEGVVRLSLHYWNTEEEIYYVTELLKNYKRM